jgi:hypothetical protein
MRIYSIVSNILFIYNPFYLSYLLVIAFLLYIKEASYEYISMYLLASFKGTCFKNICLRTYIKTKNAHGSWH